MLIGYFNAAESNYDAVNIIHENTCYKATLVTSILLLLTVFNSFQNMSTFCPGLSGFHRLAVTVPQTSFRKSAPKELH